MNDVRGSCSSRGGNSSGYRRKKLSISIPSLQQVLPLLPFQQEVQLGIPYHERGVEGEITGVCTYGLAALIPLFVGLIDV